jgi:hypothetical protein
MNPKSEHIAYVERGLLFVFIVTLFAALMFQEGQSLAKLDHRVFTEMHSAVLYAD